MAKGLSGSGMAFGGGRLYSGREGRYNLLRKCVLCGDTLLRWTTQRFRW